MIKLFDVSIKNTDTVNIGFNEKLLSIMNEQELADITKYSKKTQFKDGVQSCRKGTKARLQTLLEKPIKYNKVLDDKEIESKYKE